MIYYAMDNIKILGLGTPLMDRFAKVDDSFLQKFGLKKGSSNYLDDANLAKIEEELKEKLIYEYPGDNARNMLENYALLGGEGAAYAGKIAKDGAGENIEKNLESRGIYSLLEYDRKFATGRILALITLEKERTFAVYLGAGNEELDVGRLPACAMFFCTSITLLCNGGISKSAWEYAKRCKKGGAKIAISLESPKMLEEKKEKMGKVCGVADILFLNEDEMKAVEENEEGVGKLANIVFLKKGKNGSKVFVRGKEIGNVAAIKVENVVDTTGAGDAYAGGVLWALLNGKNEVEAAKIGNEIAARVIQKIGSRH
ncbi:MAG: adenosine kinase [Candidatus Micrarchaeota archaeon]